LEQILNCGLPSRLRSAAANGGFFHISGQIASRSIEEKRRGDGERIGSEKCGARDANRASQPPRCHCCSLHTRRCLAVRHAAYEPSRGGRNEL
jgi:hypothetical protein